MALGVAASYIGPANEVYQAQQSTGMSVAADNRGNELLPQDTDWLVVDPFGNVAVVPNAVFVRQYKAATALVVADANGRLVLPVAGVLTAGSSPSGQVAQGTYTNWGPPASNNDTAGQVGAISPGSPVAGNIVVLTFSATKPTAPKAVILTPANQVSAAVPVAALALTTSGFTVACNAAPPATQTLIWYYWVVF